MSGSPMRGLRRRVVLMLGTAALLASTAATAAPAINTLKAGLFGGRSDTAILGYDTVAYFADGKPVKGQDAFTYEWMGAKWKFASQAHLDLFKANPEKYAPQYGGYCAYGVSQDNLVSIEPDKFKVEGGNPLAHKALGGRSARIVVTMGMPALLYRWYFRAHSVKALERNILGFVGIAPIHETLIGLVDSMDASTRRKWMSKLRAFGRAAT